MARFFHKKFLFLLLAALVLFGALRLYYNLTDDFRISNISYELPYNPEWEFSSTNLGRDSLKKILDQKFIYLGKGAQVYAFASADDEWVLKFIKFKHLKPSFFVDLIPSIPPFASFKQANIDRKLRKLHGVFSGYKLAYLYDRENAGLIYLHFNKTEDLNLSVTLVDKIGLERKVSLDSVVFILQKKGKTLREVFNQLLQVGNIEEAKNKANLILDMYLSEYQAGIWDRDHGITHNTGFVKNKPIHLDVGKLSFDIRMKEKEAFREDILHVGYKISDWVRQHYPDYYQEILASIEKHLSYILGEESHVRKPKERLR